MLSFSPIYVVAFAGLLHASFQLGVGLLTLLSGHSLSKRHSDNRLLRLSIAYFSGAAVVTVLLFASVGYVATLGSVQILSGVWTIVAFANIVIGLSVIGFYYRRKKGTGLWIPRAMAHYLETRTKKTKHPAEAFTLGAGSVLAETPFLLGPIAVAVLTLIAVPATTTFHLQSLLLYCLIGLLPLAAIIVLIASGQKVSAIQQWRENNKLFLQYCAGSGLVVLGVYVYVEHVLGAGGL